LAGQAGTGSVVTGAGARGDRQRHPVTGRDRHGQEVTGRNRYEQARIDLKGQAGSDGIDRVGGKGGDR
jgi:hypothetical protein